MSERVKDGVAIRWSTALKMWETVHYSNGNRYPFTSLTSSLDDALARAKSVLEQQAKELPSSGIEVLQGVPKGEQPKTRKYQAMSNPTAPATKHWRRHPISENAVMGPGGAYAATACGRLRPIDVTTQHPSEADCRECAVIATWLGEEPKPGWYGGSNP